MDKDSIPETGRRRKSALVTTAAWLLLLPGLLFTLGLMKDGVQLLQGPPPAPLGDPQLQTYAAGYRQVSFVYNLAWVLLLVPAALTLFRRWRHARIHATVAVLGVCAILAWGLTLSSARPAGGQLIVLAVWGTWAVFILASIWRAAAAKDFAASGNEG
jgi:hypothetical protein